MAARPLVSTVIPVFNRAAMLREAVASVIAQTHRPIEIIIVDDGSTDETVETCAELARAHPEIRVLHQQNCGIGAARETGRRALLGEYVQYLDSDDLLEPTKFEYQVAALEAAPHAGVAYGPTVRVDMSTGKREIWARTGERFERIFPDFLMRRGWHTSSPLWRRSVCDRVGPWASLSCLEDWEHDIRAGLLGAVPLHVPGESVVVRDHVQMRASGASVGFSLAVVRDMSLAHQSVWYRMRAAGAVDWSYVQPLSRTAFWIARLCAERGLVGEARLALAVAEEMAASHCSRFEMVLFRRLAMFLGWPRAARIAERARSLALHSRNTTG